MNEYHGSLEATIVSSHQVSNGLKISRCYGAFHLFFLRHLVLKILELFHDFATSELGQIKRRDRSDGKQT